MSNQADLTDPLPIAQALIRAKSVTPADDGAIAVVESALEQLGFTCTRLRFGPIENLYARRGTKGPHLCFAGHTDVVPTGDLAGWTVDPFAAEIRDGLLMGRGATDMKGGVAAFIAAVAQVGDVPGSISFLITGDEEADAVDGTVKVLGWMAEQGEIPDMALVGEPTSKAELGDTIKIGRRGSMNAAITIHGIQGHAAYPQRADNPVHRLVRVLHGLTAKPLDEGTDWFEPSSLQVTSIDVGNPATNVIPGMAKAKLNIRFNDLHTGASLSAMLKAALETEKAPRYELDISISGESFVTKPGPYVDALRRAVVAQTGREAVLDTGGGTSDARFIARYCPVAELGAVGTTMHKADESTPVDELRALSRLYARVIGEVMGQERA